MKKPTPTPHPPQSVDPSLRSPWLDSKMCTDFWRHGDEESKTIEATIATVSITFTTTNEYCTGRLTALSLTKSINCTTVLPIYIANTVYHEAWHTLSVAKPDFSALTILGITYIG